MRVPNGGSRTSSCSAARAGCSRTWTSSFRSKAPMKRLFALLLLAAALPVCADTGVIKAATIAPKGSIYHRALQEMGEAYRKAAPQGRFIIYTDGIQGTEADTVRRMRIGQLDISMITVVGLTEIDPSTAAL